MNRFENRLNTNLKKWHILNPVWDNEKEDALNVFKMIDLLNEFDNENKKLEKENLDLSEELDYYKTKCASLETAYIHEQDENWRLEKSKMEFANELGKTIDENEELKQELFESEKEWYECHYADNPVRLDSKLEALKEEFKERFGRDFE